MFKNTHHFLQIETAGRYPLSSLLLPTLSLNYDEAPPPIKHRASRTPRYPEMARDFRTTQDHQIQREISTRDTSTRDLPPKERKPGHPMLRHSLLYIGVGMLITLVLVIAAQVTGNWLSNTIDDIRYGNPRTFQVDAFVGHETGPTPSHFIALNLHGRIEIIEFPGGDGTKAKIYLGPQLYDLNADRLPVKLQFIDVQHNHHPDMYVQFGNTQIVFHNTGTGFQSP